jgi:Myb-like DNA-binding domain
MQSKIDISGQHDHVPLKRCDVSSEMNDELRFHRDSVEPKLKALWTDDDDRVLLKAITDRRNGDNNTCTNTDNNDQQSEVDDDWDEIAKHVPEKSAVQCLKRYMKIREQIPSVSPPVNEQIESTTATVVQPSSCETTTTTTTTEEEASVPVENQSRKKRKIIDDDGGDDWNTEETSLLVKLVELYEESAPRWNEIADNFPDRSALDCLTKWQRITMPSVIKGKGSWTPEEDVILREKRILYGRKWAQIATHLPGRQGKQCRERYVNHLDPNLRKGEWTDEEDMILIAMHEVHGNRWASISKHLPGRSDNDAKKHWHSSIQRKFMMHGKDVSSKQSFV